MEIQATDQPINVADWRRDEEFAQYPEGARDKTLLYCPRPVPYAFLKAGHRYLFKLSSPRYPEQFWAEIIAYRLGIQMDIDIPPAFVAYDSKTNQSGALIEWFLRPIGLLSSEDYIAGGDYCQQYIPNFDRKKGRQHNFETVSQIFEDLCKKHPSFHENWINYWAKAFLFDALIGNTDRHHANAEKFRHAIKAWNKDLNAIVLHCKGTEDEASIRSSVSYIQRKLLDIKMIEEKDVLV